MADHPRWRGYRVTDSSGRTQCTGNADQVTGLEKSQGKGKTFRAQNVPPAYADRYRDSAASRYRYSSGSVYRIDPASRRIAEVIKLPTL